MKYRTISWQMPMILLLIKIDHFSLLFFPFMDHRWLYFMLFLPFSMFILYSFKEIMLDFYLYFTSVVKHITENICQEGHFITLEWWQEQLFWVANFLSFYVPHREEHFLYGLGNVILSLPIFCWQVSLYRSEVEHYYDVLGRTFGTET